MLEKSSLLEISLIFYHTRTPFLNLKILNKNLHFEFLNINYIKAVVLKLLGLRTPLY